MTRLLSYGMFDFSPKAGESATTPTPTNTADRTRNPLRPTTLDDMIGQSRLRSMLRRIIAACERSGRPMSHTLLVAASGTGKSTIANIIGNELGVQVFQVEAPVSHETLLTLRPVMCDRDILFIDEVHQQAIAERRGKSSATQPEVLFNIMEDRTIVTGTGVLPFPAITVVAATTDEGALPDAFVNRFPLRPVIEPYTVDDLVTMAYGNAQVLGLAIDLNAATAFAVACRGVPRVLNNYIRNAGDLSYDGHVDAAAADEVLADLNGTTPDGLTRDMQNALVFIYEKGRQVNKSTGDVDYKASVASIATGIGKSRDQKAVQLRVEPYLIECGFLQVGHGGRRLTERGIRRAQELSLTRQEAR
jgi:Holliday junction DNA helicase RuvB